mgnify:CR=1 FL=1
MIVIGDSLIENLKGVETLCYKCTSLEKYILMIDSKIDCLNNDNITLCFGVNDLNNGCTIDEFINNYNIILGLYKNIKSIILPPFISLDEANKIIESIEYDVEFYLDFLDNYVTIDGLHPDENTILELFKNLNGI